MSQHPIEGLMDVTLERIKSMVDSNTIIGNPINMADGTLVLPISKVTFGFASGGADFPSKTTKDLFGGGGGAGVSIQPVAFLVVKDGQRAHAAACRYLQQCRPRHWYAAGHG